VVIAVETVLIYPLKIHQYGLRSTVPKNVINMHYGAQCLSFFGKEGSSATML